MSRQARWLGTDPGKKESVQHSSMTLFCDECGRANNPNATRCVACQHQLTRMAAVPSITPQVVPVSLSPPAIQEVIAGSPLASNQHDFQAGTILAERYQIQEEIGRGGFSVVYRAVDLNDQNLQVAIKRIQLGVLTPREVIEATETFNRDVRMLSRFQWVRGVPKFYAHLTDPENWYLVMEYIKGSTLEEWLQKTPGGYFDEKKTIRIGIKIAQILQFLHTDQPPVIFRDVKPANIMLTPKEELFLIDFGIARTFAFGKAKDTTPLGSPGYAPPEQYGRAQTDRRADIYSLGATLQTLVTGRDPLELAEGKPPCNPEPPSAALNALLAEMLSPESVHRPVDMLHVRTRLEKCLPENIQRAQNVQSPPVVTPIWWNEIASDASVPGCFVMLILGAMFWFLISAPFPLIDKSRWILWFTLSMMGILCITYVIRFILSKWFGKK